VTKNYSTLRHFPLPFTGEGDLCVSKGRVRGIDKSSLFIFIITTIFILTILSDPALAQITPRKIPFGIGGAEGAATAPTNTVAAWILVKQSEFYKAINTAVLAAKLGGTATWYLAWLSFAYGVFHAAGPGHGKAIIASYMVANESALKRGILLSFLAATLQACVAIAIIGVISLIFHGTAKDMTQAGSYIELISYAAMFVLGLWLIWRKARGFIAALRGNTAHVHGINCNHNHMPAPTKMSNLREIAATVFAAGLRPCTGAILVLVFSLAQGILFAGVLAVIAMSLGTALTTSLIASLAVYAKVFALKLASSNSRFGMIAIRGVELAAAVFVCLLGAGLLFGFLAGGGA
jgi:nickel/cobalt transporter (NicO) family protein